MRTKSESRYRRPLQLTFRFDKNVKCIFMWQKDTDMMWDARRHRLGRRRTQRWPQSIAILAFRNRPKIPMLLLHRGISIRFFVQLQIQIVHWNYWNIFVFNVPFGNLCSVSLRTVTTTKPLIFRYCHFDHVRPTMRWWWWRRFLDIWHPHETISENRRNPQTINRRICPFSPSH